VYAQLDGRALRRMRLYGRALRRVRRRCCWPVEEQKHAYQYQGEKEEDIEFRPAPKPPHYQPPHMKRVNHAILVESLAHVVSRARHIFGIE
jgi:hypothetical protein